MAAVNNTILAEDNIVIGDEVTEDVEAYTDEVSGEDTQPEPIEEQAPAEEEPVLEVAEEGDSQEDGSGSEGTTEEEEVQEEPKPAPAPVKKAAPGPVQRPAPGPVQRPAAAPKASPKQGKAPAVKQQEAEKECPGEYCGHKKYKISTLQKYKYEDGTPTGMCHRCSFPKEAKSSDKVLCEVCGKNSRTVRTLKDNREKDPLKRGLLICGPCMNGPKDKNKKDKKGPAAKFWCNGNCKKPFTEGCLKSHDGYCNSCKVKIDKGTLNRPKVFTGKLVPAEELMPKWVLQA